jgi:hypothetical protein
MTRRYTTGATRQAPATEHPTALDIAWAAGIYEGEGTCQYVPSGSIHVLVPQKDPWLVNRFQALFGGGVHYSAKINQWRWNAYGVLGRGFLMTIYKFLSPWRKAQALRALTEGIEIEKWKALQADTETPDA